MENQKQETEWKWSKSQLQSEIKRHLLEENSINDVFSMFVNGLIYGERQTFLNAS